MWLLLSLSRETERSLFTPEDLSRGILLGERTVDASLFVWVVGVATFFLVTVFVNKGLHGKAHKHVHNQQLHLAYARVLLLLN